MVKFLKKLLNNSRNPITDQQLFDRTGNRSVLNGGINGSKISDNDLFDNSYIEISLGRCECTSLIERYNQIIYKNKQFDTKVNSPIKVTIDKNNIIKSIFVEIDRRYDYARTIHYEKIKLPFWKRVIDFLFLSPLSEREISENFPNFVNNRGYKTVIGDYEDINIIKCRYWDIIHDLGLEVGTKLTLTNEKFKTHVNLMFDYQNSFNKEKDSHFEKEMKTLKGNNF